MSDTKQNRKAVKIAINSSPQRHQTRSDTIEALNSGTLDSRLFLALATCVLAYLVFMHDWSPLEAIRIQMPITFVQESQPIIAMAGGGSVRIDTVRISTSAAFDLATVAKAEGIQITQGDLSADAARQEYIRRYGSLAVAEMKKYGIPASITLAQGLLESGAGQSRLATKGNNHFGIKCFSKRCKNGHCMNVSDDTHKDFFIKYASVWASYRDHSKLLRNGRYAHIQGDYQDWARALKTAGYATARDYDKSLIKLIRLYGLDRLDRT